MTAIATRWLGAAFLASGALAIAGALLPWLTLYAGLYRYSGTVGLYGRIILAAGILAMFAGAITLRTRNRRLAQGGLVLGLLLLAFSAWLYAGLVQIVNRPDSAMLVARAGPGLLFVSAGAVVLLIASAIAAGRTRRRTR